MVGPDGDPHAARRSSPRHPVVDRCDRSVAELAARPRDVDRASPATTSQNAEPRHAAAGRAAAAARHAASPPPATARARPRGIAAVRRLDALRREQAGDELAEDVRLAVGDEVAPRRGAPFSAPSTRPSTTLSTCVVDVRWRPPPIHAKRLLRTASTSAGRIVVSPGPQTSRGRTTTVSRSSPARRARPARRVAFVRAVQRRASRGAAARSRRPSTSGSPCQQRGLGADVDEARHAGAAARPRARCACPVTLTRSKSARVAPLAERAPRSGRRRRSRAAPAVIAATSSRSPVHRLGAARRATTLARCVAARQRAHAPALGDEPLRSSAPPMKPEAPVTKARAASRATLPERCAISSAGSGALAHDRPVARSSRSRAGRRRSTGRPGARRRRARGRRRRGSPAGRPASRRASGAAGEVGARLQDRPRARRSAAARRRAPARAGRASPGPRRRRAGSGAPGSGSSSVTAPGSSARAPRACARRARAARRAPARASKNMTAAACPAGGP